MTRPSRTSWLAIAACAALASSCTGEKGPAGPAGPAGADGRGPAIVAVDPPPGVIANDTRFTVTFSEAVDPATIHSASVYLAIPDGLIRIDAARPVATLVPATLSYDAASRRVTLIPVDPLRMNRPFVLYVTTAVRDLEHNPTEGLAASYVTGLDRVAPRVIALDPVPGGVVRPVPAPPAVVFDELLSLASGAAARMAVLDAAGTPVAGSTGFGGYDVHFDPAGPFTAGASYTAVLDAIAADDQGNWAPVSRRWSFSVETATLPAMKGPPVVAPAIQGPTELVEVTVPVNGLVRFVDVYLEELAPWGTVERLFCGELWGNERGEGYITGIVGVPAGVHVGPFVVGVVASDGGSSSSFWADADLSTTSYTTWTSSDSTHRVSPFPLTFLGIPGRPDLAMAVDLVRDAAGAGELRYTLSNVGVAAAGPFVAGLFVDPSAPPAVYSVPDHWLDVAGLAPGATTSGSLLVPDLAGTIVRVWGIADLTASILEPNEEDNLAYDVDCLGTCWSGAGQVWLTSSGLFARYTWAQAGVANNGRANAQAFCVARGGTLARPDSQASWDALRANLAQDSLGWWMDGHNNYTCGTAAPGSPKPYEYGLMYAPTGFPLLYTGCNCSVNEPGLAVYRYSGTYTFDACQGNGGTRAGYLGVMDVPIGVVMGTIPGFICEL